MISFVRTSDFKTYITKDSLKMKNLEKKLTENRKDVVKTDCPIVICGKICFNSFLIRIKYKSSLMTIIFC